MTRVSYIESAIRTFTAGQALPSTNERIEELARFIDGHLAPDNSPDVALLTLRMVRAVVDEALRPTARRSPVEMAEIGNALRAQMRGGAA